MNKRIIHSFNVLLILATFNNTIFSSDKSAHNELLISSAFIGSFFLVCYSGLKLYSSYKEKKLPDTSEVFQNFARAVLNENDPKDTKLLPLKVGNEWSIQGGSFMETDPFDVKMIEDVLANRGQYTDMQKKIIIADAKYSLLHEKKHYYNNDFGKGMLLQGIKFIVLNMLRRYINNLYFRMISAMISLKTIDPMITRKQERDADLYAFMNMPLEDLSIVKTMCEVKAESLEALLFDYANTKNRLSPLNSLSKEERIKKIKSDELEKVSTKVSSGATFAAISFQKRLTVEIASFLLDPAHPSHRSRMELAGECLKKRSMQCLRHQSC